jgi:hypothetical protein
MTFRIDGITHNLISIAVTQLDWLKIIQQILIFALQQCVHKHVSVLSIVKGPQRQTIPYESSLQK